jgi:hypothetical protein
VQNILKTAHQRFLKTHHLFEEYAALLDVGAGSGGADVQHVDQAVLPRQKGHHRAARHLQQVQANFWGVN